MKEKVLYGLIIAAGIVSLLLYTGSRFLPFMNLFLVEKMDTELQEFTTYGDLYYNNCIAYFKEDLPPQIRRYRLSDENPDINHAEILTYGDSFFDISFQKTLPERLTDTLNENVYAYITQVVQQANPFCLLNESGYQRTGMSKVIIVESAERNIPMKFRQPYDAYCQEIFKPNQDPGSKLLNEYLFKSNDEQLFNLMLKRSYPTAEIYSFFSSLRFKWFGSISSKTPLYRVSPEPWLFYTNSVDNGPGSFYYKCPPDSVEAYADNIARLSQDLKELYNLDMIFMAVPNKITLYHNIVVHDAYNGFLPDLQAELEERGVKYVDLYSAFITSPDTLYFGTDTHWNKKGVDLALQETLQVLGKE